MTDKPAERPPMKANSDYIGDGVYLRHDGFQLWLANGTHENDVIAIDEEVFGRLVRKGAERFAAVKVPTTKVQ